VLWRTVYADRATNEACKKSDMHGRLNGWTGLLDADSKDHGRVRRLLSHAFSVQSLKEQEGRMQGIVDLLINGLKSECAARGEGSGEAVVDMCLWIQWTTFDIMGDLAFGEAFGGLANKRTHPWQQFMLDYIAAAVWTGVAERWGLKSIAEWCAPPSLLRAVKRFHDLASEKIEKRMAMGSDRGDLLDHVLKHGLVEGERNETVGEIKGIHVEELKNVATDIAIAGSETSSALLSGLLFFLLENPDVLETVTAEVRTLPSDDEITVASTAKLPYFVAVLEEGMRILHPVPITAARTAPPGGVIIGGYVLPKGTRMWMSHYNAYRSPLHFARPEEFLPERWMADRPEEFANDNESGKWKESWL
jgi:averantin hydroxylase